MNNEVGSISDEAQSLIADEILKFKKCKNSKSIFNHYEYVMGMIGFASRMNILSINIAITLTEQAKAGKNAAFEGKNINNVKQVQ